MEIKIKQLEGEHRSRSIQIKTKHNEIIGPIRTLNKREIDKFRQPNYIPGQEKWLGGVLPHDLIEYTLDLYSGNYYRFSEDNYFNYQRTQIMGKLEGYDRKFKIVIPRVDQNFINNMTIEDVTSLITLQHTLELNHISIPDISYRGSLNTFTQMMKEVEKLKIVQDNDLSIMPVLYLDEPNSTLFPKLEWLLNNSYNSTSFIYSSGKERKLYRIYELIADKDYWIHLSNIRNKMKIKNKNKILGRVHLVPMIIGDTMSGWIQPYRPNRLPPSNDPLDFSENLLRQQKEIPIINNWQRFESDSIGIHESREHKSLYGNNTFLCNCPLCLNKNIDELVTDIDNMPINVRNNALIVHETYESNKEFQNFKDQFLSDSSLTYLEYLKNKEYVNDVINDISGFDISKNIASNQKNKSLEEFFKTV